MRAAVSIALLLAACSSTPRTAPAPTSLPEATAPPPAQPPRPAAAEVAARARDDLDCEREAEKTLHAGDTSYGWELTRACAEHDKLRSLPLLLASKFRSSFDALSQDKRAELVARVLAVRGGTIDEDIGECLRAKVGVYSLGIAFTSPTEVKRGHLVFRGRVSAVRNERHAVFFEIDEMSLGAVTDKNRIPSRYGRSSAGASSSYSTGRRSTGYVAEAFYPTGRSVSVRIAEPHDELSSGEEFVFLTKLESIEPGSSEEAGEAVVRLIRAYRPGMILPELRRPSP